MNWQLVGYIGVALFLLAIFATFIARRLFTSSDLKKVNFAEAVLGGLGGPQRYREAATEKSRRFH